MIFLEHALDDERVRLTDHATVALVDIGAHDDVDETRLVLEREEDEAFCRARTLARDDDARDFAHQVLRHRGKTIRGKHVLPIEFGAEMIDRLHVRDARCV